jgi:outer membrane immunogenic protein
MVLASSAIAMADGTPSRSAPCCAPFTWTGFYIGAHGGWYQARTDAAYHVDDDDTFVGDRFTLNGGVFGGHIGYNLQTANVVIGIEADYSAMSNGSDTRSSFAAVDTAEGDALSTKTRLDSVATVRGRLGVASGQTLFYATAGVAFANAEYTAKFFDSDPGVTFTKRVNLNDTGAVFGGGIEQAIGSGFSMRAEYLHMVFDSENNFAVGSLGGSTIAGDHARLRDIDEVRLGITYKFGERERDYRPLK